MPNATSRQVPDVAFLRYRNERRGRPGPENVRPIAQKIGLAAYLCPINSFSLKDCFYTEALRDRLNDAPATNPHPRARCQPKVSEATS